ncbi:hypothetical protein CBR_g29608 [Chara braunii]|uniref:Uncharacterized protein n=1 Tax=Chara braunii TaxID=69332 RepID=A0A388LBA0_CHABU|nr:hypothetical protein CBR_g29608 [Chara braunii]|eukprot:GBG79462.1 hypothetical protein CBR_g29608 [Chara braunii]
MGVVPTELLRGGRLLGCHVARGGRLLACHVAGGRLLACHVACDFPRRDGQGLRCRSRLRRERCLDCLLRRGPLRSRHCLRGIFSVCKAGLKDDDDPQRGDDHQDNDKGEDKGNNNNEDGKSEDRELPRGDTSGRSLPQLCRLVERAFFEVCVQNLGRPAGMALYDFTVATSEAFFKGFTRDQLALELRFGSHHMDGYGVQAAGYRLTSSEERYRSQWIDTIYVTLHMMKVVEPEEASNTPDMGDEWLRNIVHRVLEGQRTGEEQTAVKFDRALATAGASGGAAAQKKVIAPQWVPVSQIVLLTMKVVAEAQARHEL